MLRSRSRCGAVGASPTIAVVGASIASVASFAAVAFPTTAPQEGGAVAPKVRLLAIIISITITIARAATATATTSTAKRVDGSAPASPATDATTAIAAATATRQVREDLTVYDAHHGDACFVPRVCRVAGRTGCETPRIENTCHLYTHIWLLAFIKRINR